MEQGSRFFSYFCLTLLIVGAVNWGLIGFFQFDLIGALFGTMSGIVSRIIFALIGLAGLYSLTFYSRVDDRVINRD